MTETFDVAVIGGGPAGASAAIVLAQAGRSVLLVERERFPRFHIGESMLPMSNGIFARLGVAEEIEGEDFTTKLGATIVDETGERSVSYDFAEDAAVPEPRTYQVPRDRFDRILLERARAAGAEVWRARARDLLLGAEGVTMTVEREDGETTVATELVIDASGRSGFVAKRVGVREPDPSLDKVAIYAHFRDVPRLDDRRSGDIRIVSLGDLGWIWFIPLPGEVMSVGLVIDVADYRPSEGPATAFDRVIAGVPSARELMKDAERIGELRTESSFSYRTRAYADGRWLLAGDAASFLDPVFSSGVLLALLAGTEAADAADRALARPAARRAAIRDYDRVQRRRYQFVRRLVTGFYSPALRDLFFEPARRFGLVRAVTTMLAGDWDPGWLDRIRLETFFLAGRLQRWLPLVPRIHRQRAVLESTAD